MQEGLPKFALECSVCMDPFRVPATLPCGHTFCSPCLVQLPVRECPLCKKRFTLVPDVNIVLRDMVNLQYGSTMDNVIYEVRDGPTNPVLIGECDENHCDDGVEVCHVEVENARNESRRAFVIVSIFMSLVSIVGGCGLLMAYALGTNHDSILMFAGVSFIILVPLFFMILAFAC